MCVILKCILPQPRIENCRDLQISVGNPDPFPELPVFVLDLDPTKMKEQINKFNFFQKGKSKEINSISFFALMVQKCSVDCFFISITSWVILLFDRL